MFLVIIMKKNNKIKNKSGKNIVSTDNEMLKLIFVVIIVAVVFVIFYIIALFVIKKDDEVINNETTKEVVIQYDKILATNILEQKPNEYYVLVYDKDDKYVDLYLTYLNLYKAKKMDEAVPYYTVDLYDVFNSQFVSDKSNLNVKDSKDFKFNQTTLLRIIDGKVISTYETKDVIVAKFGRMTK